MMQRMGSPSQWPFTLCLIACLMAASPRPVSAAHILFVADGFSDTSIVDVLRADGHTVETVINDYVERTGDNPSLHRELAGFDVIFWSATGLDHRSPAVFANLDRFVLDGGRVFVTGFDAIASPEDPRLIAFLGGSGSIDAGSALGPLSMVPTSLTTGVVDIRGVTPSGHALDRDMLIGLRSDTIDLAPGSAPGLPDGSSWTLRRLGRGEIAFISNGEPSGDHPSWTESAGSRVSAYNAAVRNFAFVGDRLESSPGGPIIAFDGPHLIAEGLPIELAMRVTSGEPTSIAWDLNDDGVFAEELDALTITLPSGYADGPSTIEVGCRVESADGISVLSRAIRVLNQSPEILSSPPRLFFVGQTTRYLIRAVDPGGDDDPLDVELLRGPEGATVEGSDSILWTPRIAQVTLPGDVVRFEVRVSDDDGAFVDQTWTAEVSRNRPPPAPAILYPEPGAYLGETPRLVVENVEDPDRDPVVYHFEIDRVPRFDSPDLQTSGAVEPGVGFTAWNPASLPAAGSYYWRAWSCDSAFCSSRQTASFNVVVEAPPEADASIAADASVPTLPETESNGCSCGITQPSGRAGAAWLFLGACLWAGRRWRRAV